MSSGARNFVISIATCLLVIGVSVSRIQAKPTQSSIGAVSRAKKTDIEAAVAIICAPGDVIRAKDNSISGCHKCPEGTGFRQFHSDDEWVLGKSLVGHFTSAQDDNLILEGFECESLAMNNGGSFVFLMNAGKPQLLMYDEGLITDDCHKFPYADGREFLVCDGGWDGGGEVDSSVFLANFDTTGEVSQMNLFNTSDTTGACDEDPNEKVEFSDIRRVNYLTKDSGELRGLSLTATLGHIKCAEANFDTDDLEERKIPSAVKSYEIEFTYDGKRFTVDPQSRAAFRLFPKFKNSP